ncbi:hypothetical protein BpHYR1_010179 [Brachionus plicatilis]|uniref:Uncharacterized protein n=1 Tax=Brachionus plicatilis TaxID=10195 RepID=A0A3M7QE94_BRAPC|nr:hypothetical protein BpHYR1_010179 [Brachionus plicatilis]
MCQQKESLPKRNVNEKQNRKQFHIKKSTNQSFKIFESNTGLNRFFGQVIINNSVDNARNYVNNVKLIDKVEIQVNPQLISEFK